MFKKLLGIVAVACSLILSNAAFSHSMDCGKGLKGMLESLNLDDAQKEKIKPIMDQQDATMKDLAAQMDALDVKMNEQMNAAQPDQSAIDGLVEQKVKLIGQMMKAKIMAKVQIFGVLKPEQKTQLQDKLKKLADKMAEKFKNCHQDD